MEDGGGQQEVDAAGVGVGVGDAVVRDRGHFDTVDWGSRQGGVH